MVLWYALNISIHKYKKKSHGKTKHYFPPFSQENKKNLVLPSQGLTLINFNSVTKP